MKKQNKEFLERLKKHCDLGHDNRDRAFVRQVELACSSPGTPLAQTVGKTAKNPMADLVSLYRFVDNDKATISQMRDIRAQVVLEGMPLGSEILIVHDVTQLDYTQHNSKMDRKLIGDHKGKGYEYHCCVAVNPKTDSLVGVVHDTLINAQGPDDRDVMNYDYEPLFDCFSAVEKKKLRDNHRHQMAVHINGLDPLLQKYKQIHVADREFDDIFILDRCALHKSNFVVRATSYRNVQVPKYNWLPREVITSKRGGHALEQGWVCADLRKLVTCLPVFFYKELSVDSYNRVVYDNETARKASLFIGACTIRLYRIAKRNHKYFKTPRPVDVNLVVVRELNPPPGTKPLCWVLFTSLPIDSREQQELIVHYYVERWKIEPYFKLLKSGYRIEESRLDKSLKTAKLLVILSLAAMVILNLKSSLGLASHGSLNPDQYRLVKKAVLNLNTPKMSLELRTFALIAKLGGWLARKRDPIGPSILMRGILQLVAMFHTLQDFRPLVEELLEHPDVLTKMLGVTFRDAYDYDIRV